MPFCSSCGTAAHERDLYCGKCGAPQPIGASDPRADPMAGISPRLAAILCYIPTVGWIAAVIVLASRKFRNDGVVRFHAFQGLYLFAAWLFVQWAVRPIFAGMPEPAFFRVDRLLQGIILGLWIFMIIKASHEEAYSLPVIGELAHRSAAER
ncbi:MAG: hypothetical protein M3Y07_01970 [Acidobacteriota bacterium]|nr:hypothetical protein [Acidobacteriota bacterium]